MKGDCDHRMICKKCFSQQLGTLVKLGKTKSTNLKPPPPNVRFRKSFSRISAKRSKMVKVYKTHISKNITNSGYPEFYAESKNEV